MDWIREHLGVSVALAVVAVGLLVLGLRDLARFSPTRLWAIASVCFRQSIRRRVLWITPLVILGVIVVAQFQKAVDPQDAVRQTTVYCLFAAGLLVTLLAMILACTNLPAEIENRVIYTIATKPVTRLEIVLGKAVGFACVSFWILLIMGVFSFGLLHWQDWRLRREIGRQLDSGAADPLSHPTLAYYKSTGTLHARELGLPSRLSFLAHRPADAGDFYIPGAAEGEIDVPFLIDRAKIPPAEAPRVAPRTLGPSLDDDKQRWPGGIALIIEINARRVARPDAPPTQPTTAPAKAPPKPSITLEFRNARDELIFTSADIGYSGVEWPGGQARLFLHVPPDYLDKWVPPDAPTTAVRIAILGGSADYEYSVNPAGVFLQVPGGRFTPAGELFYAGRIGQQLRGGRNAPDRVALYQFRGQHLPRGAESFSFELRCLLEPDRAEADAVDEPVSRILVGFHNRATGRIIPGIEVLPESNRPIYFSVPAAAIDNASGPADFDVIVRLATSGWVTLRAGPLASVKLIIRDQSFAWNLLKSLGILWLMSVLVIITSIFCSTFLSWPIAVVLTIVIICGRYGAEQLGDLADPGIGRAIVDDMFKGTKAPTARAVSESVELLVSMLRVLAAVLPDITRFAALEDVQRGVAISSATFAGALGVTLAFGIPLLVISYLLLKHKEVAP